jgi:hypothetical protein
MGKSKMSTCPPLTTSDILTIRGKPALKRIEPSPKRGGSENEEEWVYFTMYNNTKEYYFFQKGQLVGWKKASI